MGTSSKYLIKCTTGSDFEFPDPIDYLVFFPEGKDINLSIEDDSGSVRATLMWGTGDFLFDKDMVHINFQFKTIDFGFAEQLVEYVAERITELTGDSVDYQELG